VFKIKKQQQEMTTKLILVVIGLTSFGAILVPTYAVPTIRSADIFDGEVKTADLANNAVTSPKIQNGQVNTDDLASHAVTTGKIADGMIQEQDIADGAVTSEKLADGAGGGEIQLNVHIVESENKVLEPGITTSTSVDCPDGEVLSGGGFIGGTGVQVQTFFPLDENTWVVSAINESTQSNGFRATAFCIDPTMP
jgi:hypothetical protein